MKIVPGQLVLLDDRAVLWRDATMRHFYPHKLGAGEVYLVVAVHVVTPNNWRPIIVVAPGRMAWTADSWVEEVLSRQQWRRTSRATCRAP